MGCKLRWLTLLWLCWHCTCAVPYTHNNDDDDSLYDNLNKTMLEIGLVSSENLTLDELAAALGVHVPIEHRYAAEELFDYSKNDRPMALLTPRLLHYGSYGSKEAEEFSRGALKPLIDKPFLLPANFKLEPGDHLCRCNLPECASISNELYHVIGPEMSSFCRVDRYGYCVTQVRRQNGTTKVLLFCAPSYATSKQKGHYDYTNEDHELTVVCLSTVLHESSCCKEPMCNDRKLEDTETAEMAFEKKVRMLNEEISLWRARAISLAVVILFLFSFVVLMLVVMDKLVGLRELKSRVRLWFERSKKTEEVPMTIKYCHEPFDRGSSAGSESPLITPSSTYDVTMTSGMATDGSSKIIEDSETTIGCGTGGGGTIVAQRTLSGFIRIMHPLGKGNFGNVFLGEWRGGEKIAVKKFDHTLIDSFEQEVEILMSGMMSNSNILRWIGKDTVDTGMTMEFWIMSEYHPNGSLYDYMETNSLNQHTYLTMMRGIANGISFLHSEIPIGEGGKKGVAHRDLKTKNILVKSDLTCVIADFGMAVINDVNGVKLPAGVRKSGTIRYLPPEVFEYERGPKVVKEFEFYRASDIYSFALVLWECARRTSAHYGRRSIAEHSMKDSLAYYTEVPREPTVEEMRNVVVERGVRPAIDDEWQHNPVFLEMARVMRECWCANPTARLTALNVKIVIDRISSQLKLRISGD